MDLQKDMVVLQKDYQKDNIVVLQTDVSGLKDIVAGIVEALYTAIPEWKHQNTERDSRLRMLPAEKMSGCAWHYITHAGCVNNVCFAYFRVLRALLCKSHL